MMAFIYSCLLALYSFAVLIASLFNKKAKSWTNGRRNIFERLKEAIGDNKNIVWFHSASLGEFEQGRPVIEELRLRNPDVKILLTFFSPSGYEIRKNYPLADFIFYLPVDYKHNAEKFLDIVNPTAVYFIKYEFWHNYLKTIQERNIRVYCFSAIFRPGQAFFQWYGSWYKQVLYCFTHIFVQNDQSKVLLQNIGLKNVTVTGDTRFDRVFQIASQTKNLPIVEQFKNAKPIIIAGSTWPADEINLVEYINQCNFDCKFIIAPHEIHHTNIEQLTVVIKRPVLWYSQAGGVNPKNFDVLIIDNIGMLSSIYQYANCAYIGGGFGKGIHNILEAATFGLPVVFGPEYKKFQEANDLINMGGAFSISDVSSLKTILDRLMTNDSVMQTSKGICKQYVAENIGATQKILSETCF
jgi:3-deoxy-D-manno-octulosonic-acid transferase